MARGVVRIIKFIVLAIPILFVGMCHYAMFKFPLKNAEFDKKIWASLEFSKQGEPIPHTRENKCIRGGMVGDLQDNYLSVGISKFDVMRILGEPDFLPQHTTGCISYWVGLCTGMRIDTQSLDICFDKRNQLTSAKVYKH